ncbi:response regulator [Horticoccus sp. 23ND18S-11]|uniref:response regulator n=1 Tax=Horticoccus sp. 23ND18S-11 TaxID=3391832 RepID=UPI0039C8FDD8
MTQTILIIDDFASVRLYHMSFLTRKGYRCIGANDGAEALARLHESPIDLILLDMVMPGMDGEAFIAHLDREAGHHRIPILAITSEASLAQASLGEGRRAMRVLSKPVMPETLLWGVQQLLPPSVVEADAPTH